jgi:hypothetical protein
MSLGPQEGCDIRMGGHGMATNFWGLVARTEGRSSELLLGGSLNPSLHRSSSTQMICARII